MRRRVVWLQVQGTIVFSLGLRPVPLSLFDFCQQDMGFGKVWIEFQGFWGRANHLQPFIFYGVADKNGAEVPVCVCQANVGGCKRRILPDCFFEIGNTFFDLSPVAAFDELAFEIALIDFRCDMTSVNQSRTFLPCDRDFDSLGNRLRYITFQGEGVAQLAVVGLRPEVLVSRTTNQLGVDTDATSITYHRAFDQGINAQGLRNFWHGHAWFFESHDRSTGDDANATNHR